MEWQSINDVLKEFPFETSGEYFELKDYIAFLEEKRNALHPDKTGRGTFPSVEDEEQYLCYQSAIDFLRELPNPTRAIVKQTDQTREIEKQVRALSITLEQANKTLTVLENQNSQMQAATVEKKKATLIETSREVVKSRTILPKIASGTFAAIFAVLFGIWERLEGLPILGDLSLNPSARFVWLALLVISGVGFLSTWIYESRTRQFVDDLVSELGLIETFDKVCVFFYHKALTKKLESQGGMIPENVWNREDFFFSIRPTFTKAELIRFLRKIDDFDHLNLGIFPERKSLIFRLMDLLVEPFYQSRRIVERRILPITVASDYANYFLDVMSQRNAIERLEVLIEERFGITEIALAEKRYLIEKHIYKR